MNEDFDTCYQAIRSRDARFDGRFFTAVTSTGIYCRPICPAATPKRENVRFLPSAAAAQAAGFRACCRCSPDAAPGSAEWNRRDDVVARALRLIAGGVVDVDGVPGLARRLHVGERHLHRLLMTEIGAGPLSLAQMRRLQAARALIEQTTLPMTEVALTAGFASLRQFNEGIRTSFGKTPTAMRRGSSDPIPADGAICLALRYRAPFAGKELLDFLGARAIPGVEAYRDGVLTRSVTVGGMCGIVEFSCDDSAAGHVQARLFLEDLRALAPVVQQCRRLLDLDADPAPIADVLSKDPLMRTSVRRAPGLRVPGCVDGFEMAVRAVLGQQVSVTGARTLAGRLTAAAGRPLVSPRNGITHCFPAPERLVDASLDGRGLTGGRVRAIRVLSAAILDGQIDLDGAAERDETCRRLNALPGFGPWTTSYIAMRALRDPDAFPAGDLGLRRAMERMGAWEGAPALEQRSHRWRPWRAYAARHLWSALANAVGRMPLNIAT